MTRKARDAEETGDLRERAKKEAAALVLQGKFSLEQVKKKTGAKYGLARVLKNSEILEKIGREARSEKVMQILRLRKVRTLSGVAPIAVMTMSGCPHGRCTYCPRGGEAAQSYTGFEPASLRARQNAFDGYAQVKARLGSLRQIGHDVDKCELIVMGGTFNSMPRAYQMRFMKGCIEAMNGRRSASLAAALRANEKAPVRAVGITFETRPDWAQEKDVDWLLAMGATRVEMGVQTLSDEIYKRVKRGHTVSDVIDATRVLKDSALKVCYHMMPGLYADKEKDVRMFKRLFEDPDFRPDMLKIYPCLVLEGTELYDEWKRGEFEPYDSAKAAEVIAEASKYIPPYVRVMRMQRDIPAQLIAAGVKHGNLRQLVDACMKERGIKCRCIRCREMGLKGMKMEEAELKLERLEYAASGGKEVFLSFEDKKKDVLAGFLRLRLPGRPHRKELQGAALVRELHVYGRAVPIGGAGGGRASLQHHGLGARLLAEAERIAGQEWHMKKLAVISGVGARDYYRRAGYALQGQYMVKKVAGS
ncbi:MAG: tRNA uridine(34) 5-carboxymethylaminomethyl modification radical SAM/GNAT enzyme Elp3 [Candidatus Burarchaeum sp.]|nr:tRNA uridine(34) 5-carboxymethylaminomethyl modification radical SAM/GNAT enzyme Elp3 [Candidatus Burarchaeum sp.]MDO8339869.1 tRNA uridine(34) 5-carboxymethylaminomethyl modification radical SAM/GNAT enzyme Elp3 [Candidatus Burarchaeum sp.]